MDAVQKVKDLMNLALHEGTPEKERNEAAIGAIRIISRYELLGKKRVDIAANIIEKFTNPLFVEGIADRAEKIVSGAERVMGSVKKLSDLSRGNRGWGGKRRTYGGR